jgi:hypothetical protein
MPSGFPISHDPQRDHLWSRVVDLVDQHREPGRSPHQADRDEESITWIIGGPDGSEAHVTVRERPFRDVSFRRSRGEPGVWAELEVLRVGLSTLLGFRAVPAAAVALDEQSERDAVHAEVSVRDDLGSWYTTVSGWGAPPDVDWGWRFNAPPSGASRLWVTVTDRGELFAEYVAELQQGGCSPDPVAR